MLFAGIQFGISKAPFVSQPAPPPAPPPRVTPINRVGNTIVRSPIISLSRNDAFISRFYNFPYIPPIPLINVNSTKPRKDVREKNNFGVVSVSSTPFESLTGISESRPEIMLLADFKPLYDDNFWSQSNDSTVGQDFIQGFNEFGSFLDIQMQVANFRYFNMYSLVRTIKKDKNKKEEFSKKEEQFYRQIKKLTSYINFLYSASGLIDNAKNAFNIRSSDNKLVWGNVFQTMWPNEYQKLSQFSAVYGLSDSTWIPDILKIFGYSNDNIKQFSNTKIYLQLLVELNQLLKSYSSAFVQTSDSDHSSDNQSLVINQKNNSKINSSIGDIESPIFEDLKRLNGKSVPTAVPKITSFLKAIENATSFSTQENKISFLCSFITREFRNSSALASPATVKFLRDNYGYSVNSQGNNLDIFDYVTGRLGTKITDVMINPSQNVLCNASQIVKSTAGGAEVILPFESSYIESGPSIFTPGTEYLIDSIVDSQNLEVKENNQTGFDVSRLKEHTQNINNIVEGFGEFITKFKLLDIIPDTSIVGTHVNSDDRTAQFLSPSRYADEIFSNVRQSSNNQVNPEIAADIITGIANHSSKSELLKSNLFLYFMSDFVDDGERIGVRTAAVEGIMQALKSSTTERFGFFDSNFDYAWKFFNDTKIYGGIFGLGYSFNDRYGYKFLKKTDGVDEATIRDKFLSAGSPMINFVRKRMREAFSSFSAILNGTTTSYSDLNMTMMLALVFELCLTVTKQFIGKEVTSQSKTFAIYNIGQTYFTMTNTEIANTFVYSEVSKAIGGEIVKNYYVISAILTMLRKIVNESTKLIGSLRNEESVNTLNEIIGVLGNRTLLSKMMVEQQLITAKSLIDDINLRLNINNENAENSLDTFSQVDKKDLVILDDINVGKNLRNSLFAFFAQNKFSGNKAYNMKVLSVGIPAGFSGNIREKIKLADINESSYNRKQTDVVNICVYKVDMEYQDIIFKPQKFLFELSRFVHKNDETYGQISISDSAEKLIAAIPTTDYSLELGKISHSPINPSDADASRSSLYTNEQYSFLSTSEKTSLLMNHISSFMLEIYLRFMTGIIVSEHNYTIDDTMNDTKGQDSDFIKSMVDITISRRLRGEVNENFANSNVLNETELSKITRDLIIQDHTVINDIGNIRSQYSDEMYVTRKILTPKLFDRVFNLAIDPDDFEIDIEETRKTDHGRESLDKLLKQKIVVDVSNQESNFIGKLDVTKKYKLKEKLKAENHVIFEKYFVSVETAAPSTRDTAEQEQDKIKEKYRT